MIPTFKPIPQERLTLITLRREQFYDEVWSLTGQELRIRYAISPYRLDLICQNYNLPKPPVGYWIKVRHGTKVRRRPLPELPDPALQQIRLVLLEPDLSKCKLDHAPISVPADLHEAHPMVQDVQAMLNARRASGDDPARHEGLAVTFDVPAELEERALRLLDALVNGFEAAGGQIFACGGIRLWGRPPDGVGIAVTIGNTHSDSGNNSRLAVDFTTNRQLAIKGHWADMKGQRVDGALRPIINAIFETAARVRWERLDNECTARQTERIPAREQRQDEQKFTAAKEEEFGRGLVAEAKRYEEAGVIRRYIRVIRRKLDRRAPDDCSPAVDENWLRRATRYADSIDPLTGRIPPPAHAAPLPPTLPVEGLDITSELRLRLAEMGVADTRALHGLKREQVGGYYDHKLWAEVCRVLEICGYDVADRRSRWGGYI